MNQLMTMTQATPLTMSSREIAELVEARHNDVVATIDALFEQGLLKSRRTTRRVDTGGRPVFVYDLTQPDCEIVTSGYSKEGQMKVARRWMAISQGDEAREMPQKIVYLSINTNQFPPEVVAQIACGKRDEGLANAYADELVSHLISAVNGVADAEVVYETKQEKEACWAYAEGVRHIVQSTQVLLDRYPDALAKVQQALTVAQFAMTGYIFAGLGGIADQAGKAKEKRESTYIVRNPKSGLIKIGRSINPAARIKSLECGSGASLETIAILPGNRERELHKKFSELRVFGEWFRDDGRIESFAKEAA